MIRIFHRKRRTANGPNRFKKKGGFTLNELLVTLIVASCVGAFAIPSYNTIISRSRAKRVALAISNAADLKTAYFNDPGTTDAQRTAWDTSTEPQRISILAARGVSLNGKAITSDDDLLTGTEQTSITLGDRNTGPTIP
jgi:Tfp pilus assembly protein PilE